MTDFDYGENDKRSSFQRPEEGEVHPDLGHPPQSLFDFGDPVPPPCPQVSAKQLKVMVISRETAKNIWLTHHYLHRDVPAASLELGIFTPDMVLRGGMCFSKFVVGTKDHAGTWELRRMFLSDDLPKNSESRVLSVAFKIIKKLNPEVNWIVSYSDPSRGHKGTIYRAAGFFFDGMSGVNEGGFNPYGNTKEMDRVSKRRWKKRLW